MTPLYWAIRKDRTEVVDLLFRAGASLSVVNNQVIKPTVKLRQSNIKPFKWHVIFLLKQIM
jgi:ankyrin repeat protein